jgi:hypothetical protein
MIARGSFYGVALALVCLVSGVAHAGIVFGNLGQSGDGLIDSGNVAQIGSTVSGSSGNRFAIAFVTGSNSDFLQVQSVVLGLGDISPFSTAILKLVDDNVGFPTGSTLATSSLVVQSNSLYTFGLGGVSLAANTKYWVTLEAQDSTAPSTFSWLRVDSAESPTGLNGSGYTFPAGGGMRSTNDGAWTTRSDANTLSISVTAVPEPSTCMMALAGLACGGYLVSRRPKRA